MMETTALHQPTSTATRVPADVGNRANGDPVRRSLVQDAYQAIRQRILDNIYRPGYQALEPDLAEQLGISRTPVREALIRLREEGLLEIIPRHGMRVLPVSAADMKDIYEILTSLEATAAQLAAMRKPSQAELAGLDQSSQDMAHALAADDLDAWAQADERFHRALIELSGNRLLVQSVLNYWDRAHRARMFTLRLRPRPESSTKEHLALVDCIRAGDAKGAFDFTRAHRERGSRELLSILEKYRLAYL